MAPCTVCNEETSSKDLNGSTMATIRSRLEKVLEEAVPASAMLCPSCDFDLNQIEMYYTLLANFKKRYYDGANICRQQMKSSEEHTSRNVLDESTEFSSKKLQGIFGASNFSTNIESLLPLQTETSEETCSTDIPPLDIKLEINDVRSLQNSQQQNQLVEVEPVSNDIVVIPQKWQEKNQQLPNTLGNSEQTEAVQRPAKDIHINAEVSPEISATSQHNFGDSDSDDNVVDAEDLILAEELVLPNLMGTCRDNTKLDIIPTKSEGEESKIEESNSHDTATDIQSEITLVAAVGSQMVKRKRGRPRKYRQTEFLTSNSDLDIGCVGSELASVKEGARTMNTFVNITGSTVASRKRGRPREKDNPTIMPSTDSVTSTESSQHGKNEESKIGPRKSGNNLNRSAGCKSKNHTLTHTVPREQSIVHIKKCGRPRKHNAENDIQSSRSVASQIKWSRPQSVRSHEEHESDKAILEEEVVAEFDVGESMIGDSEMEDTKKFISPSNIKPGTSSVIGTAPAQKRKRGRPRKNEHASIKPIKHDKPCCTEEAVVEEPYADVPKLNESEKESVSPSKTVTDSTSLMSPVFKRKRGRPKKAVDPDFAPVQHSKQKRREKNVKNTTGKTNPVCAICDEVFPDRLSLKSHMMIHISDKIVSCTFCGKEFKSPSALEQHESVHTGKKRYQCEICGKKISRGSSLRMHLNSHSELKSFECDKCNKKFKNQKYLESHINKHHVQGRQVLCTVCGKAFFTMKVLKIHMLIHSGQRVKSFECKFCNMLFYTKGELGHHERTHKDKTERQKYICPVCGKAFVQKAYLKYHMVSHTGESKHHCTNCDQVFKTASEHQRHMWKHTGEKPYKCSTCGKAFRISSNLYAHKKIHTGERPYKCICGTSFPVKTMLDRHMGTKKHADFIEKMKGKPATSAAMAMPVAMTDPIPTAEQHNLVTGYQSSM